MLHVLLYLFQEPIYIGGSSVNPENKVMINGLEICTDSAPQTILLFVLSFLTFNLCHSPKQEATVEALEGLLKIRKQFSRQSTRATLKLLFVI